MFNMSNATLATVPTTSKTDFRRLLGIGGIGSVVRVVNHRFPELSGDRTLVNLRSRGFALRLPESHPRYTPEHEGSWTHLDQTDVTYTVTPEGSLETSYDGERFATYTLLVEVPA